MIYILNCISLLIWGWLCKHIKNVNKSGLFFSIMIIQMSLIVGLRYQVGADYLTYERMYQRFGENILLSVYDARIEVGYRALNWMFWNVNMPFWFFCLFLAFLTHFFACKTIDALCKTYDEKVCAVYLYIALFFFYHSMNMMRQGVAMTIGMYAVVKLIENNRKKFFCYILIASLFHTITAVVYLLAYVMMYIKLSKKTFALYALSIFIVLNWYEILLDIASHTKYSVYLNQFYNKSNMASTFMNLIVRCMLLIIVLVMYKYMQEGKKKIVLYNMVVLCTVLQVLTTKSSIFGRVTTPLFLAYVVLLPNAISDFKSRYKKLIWWSCYLGATCYQIVYYHYNANSVLVNSYQSVLDIW